MLPPEIDSHLLDELVIVVSLIATEQLRRSTIDPLHWHSSSDRSSFALNSGALVAPSNTHEDIQVSVKSVNAAMQHFLYGEAHILLVQFINSTNKDEDEAIKLLVPDEYLVMCCNKGCFNLNSDSYDFTLTAHPSPSAVFEIAKKFISTSESWHSTETNDSLEMRVSTNSK